MQKVKVNHGINNTGDNVDVEKTINKIVESLEHTVICVTDTKIVTDRYGVRVTISMFFNDDADDAIINAVCEVLHSKLHDVHAPA